MSKIAILITDMFEDIEYKLPVRAFNKADHEIIHVGLNEGNIVKSKKQKINVKIDESIDNISIHDFDALFIPGGYSPDKLRIHEQVVDFVAKFVNSEKPVFSICHAPQLLITADVVKGGKITGWKSIIQDIKNAGGEFVDQDVVIDNNLVSSRSPKEK